MEAAGKTSGSPTHTHTHAFTAVLWEKMANVFMNPVHVLVPGGRPGETCR